MIDLNRDEAVELLDPTQDKVHTFTGGYGAEWEKSDLVCLVDAARIRRRLLRAPLGHELLLKGQGPVPGIDWFEADAEDEWEYLVEVRPDAPMPRGEGLLDREAWQGETQDSEKTPGLLALARVINRYGVFKALGCLGGIMALLALEADERGEEKLATGWRQLENKLASMLEKEKDAFFPLLEWEIERLKGGWN